jgi:hypothetical protein
MEKLNNAARAAGFAMAASDEPYEDVEAQGKDTEASGWRPNEAVLLAPTPIAHRHRGDWIRAMLSLFGRRAPASPV